MRPIVLRRQWDLWNAEVKAVLGEEPESSYEGRLKQMFECYDYSVRFVTLSRTDIWKIVGEQFRDATFTHNKALTEFVEAVRTSGRIASLWRRHQDRTANVDGRRTATYRSDNVGGHFAMV